MPIVTIPMSGSAFQAVDKQELSNPEVASKFDNLILSQAGSSIGRPGLSSFTMISNSAISNCTIFNNHIFAVTEDRVFWKIDSAGTVTNLVGADGLLGGSDRPTFASDGTYLAIAGGGVPMRWDGTNDVENMPGSPPSTNEIVFMDGYWLAIDDTDIRWAGPTAVTRETWSAADFFQPEGQPDDPVSIKILQKELFIFGDESLEVWQNFGDASVPFRRVFFVDIGTSARQSIVQANNTLWFLDEDRRFVFLNGRTPQIVSIPALDREIQRLTTVSDCFGNVIQIDGNNLITWTFPTEGKCYVFDYARSQYIGEWYGFEDSAKTRFRMNSHVYWRSENKHYVGDYDDGTIWELSAGAYSDGSLPRRCRRRSGEIDHGTGNRKRNNSYRFHVKRGVATTSVTDPKMEVRFRDDGKPWSNPYHVSLGQIGDELSVIKIHNTGIYRKRQIEVVCTDAVDFKLMKVEEDVEAMAT